MLDCKDEKGNYCGRCCRFMLIEIADKVSDDWLKWARFHFFTVSSERSKFHILRLEDRYFLRINEPCFYLGKDNTCQIYEYRPQMCKNFHCEDLKFKHVKHLLQ